MKIQVLSEIRRGVEGGAPAAATLRSVGELSVFSQNNGASFFGSFRIASNRGSPWSGVSHGLVRA